MRWQDVLAFSASKRLRPALRAVRLEGLNAGARSQSPGSRQDGEVEHER